MRKITLFFTVLFTFHLAFAQTPCDNISLLDCAEVQTALPVNLTFSGSEGGVLSTGFTMVDPPSSRLDADDALADPDVTGLIASNLALSAGVLNVTATNGINFSQLSGTPNSTLTNSQMNALGVGFAGGSGITDVTAAISQPNFAGSINNGDNGAQQAGIWLGLNENNFAKLVLVKVSGTQQKVQLALEQTDPNNSTNLLLTELNTTNFNISGISNIQFRLSINPADNSVTGFYRLDGAPEVQVGGVTGILTAPASFLNGVDHDANPGTDNLTYAGIMTSTRRATGGSLVIGYDSFSVQETIPPAAPFEAHVNFQDDPAVTTPPPGYLADYGKEFGNASVVIGIDGYAYGWKLASNGTPIDATGNGGVGRNRIGGSYAGASLQDKLEGTLVHFQGDNIAAWSGQARGNELIWELEIPNGVYEVTLGLGDKGSTNLDSRHSATVEGFTIIPAFAPGGGEIQVASMIVQVTDGLLTLNGLGGYNSKITHMDIVESTGTPVDGLLQFSPSNVSESLAAGSTGLFSSDLSGVGAGTISLLINDHETAGNDWLTLPATNTLGQFDFAIDASTLSDGNTRSNTIIATAQGYSPALLEGDLTVTAALSSENDILTFGLPEQTGPATIDTDAHTVAVEVLNGTDLSNLTPVITVSDVATIDPLSGVTRDFSSTVNYTVTAEDNGEQLWAVSVSEAAAPFEAHVNFQDQASVPPAPYLADYGKQFGNASIVIDFDSYAYGWKLAADGAPIDASNEAANNSNGVGRNRLGSGYATASDQEKLEGTLVHFQGDNILNNTGGIQSWAGQPRGNELIWELEIPNGNYDVTVSLGDQGTDIDSRHSATVEGYTVVPAFVPSPNENRSGTVTVEVTDGFLTITGLGGYNSKINFIDVVESGGTPVSGILSFSPSGVNESLVAGSSGSFSSELSGTGATLIGLVINDNINAVDKTITGSNDWLTLPAASVLGQFDFAMDASALPDGDTRSNTIIATAQGFTPALLEADLSVTAVPVAAITAPYRMNVFGADYTKDGDLFEAENLAYLQQTQPTQTSITAYTPYNIPGGHTELYYPRRFGPEFSYNFPIANGNYTVALHMVENFQTAAGARIFDVSIEEELKIDDIDLFDDYGKGELALLSFDITVLDGVLNIDFLASANNAIIQAIEILPSPLSSVNDILTFSLPEQTGPATIDTDNHMVVVEVANGTDLSNLAPTITVSNAATIDPLSGVTRDFSSTVNYTVTAEDSSEQLWAVTVTEAVAPASPCNPLSTLDCDQILVAAPVALTFDGSGTGLEDTDGEGTGFTMADPHSEARLTEDGPASNPDVNGYEPSLLNVNGGNLNIIASKGIAYLNPPESSNNNNQINTLGVGLSGISTPLTIETTLIGITTGGSAAQAGIWFGVDEDNFVKLNVNSDNVEMRREIGGFSVNGDSSPDQIQVNAVGVSGQNVTLRLVVDPVGMTITGYYAINGGSFVQLTKTGLSQMALPAGYLSGREISPSAGNGSFAGVYATYRNGSVFTATFDYFNVEEQLPLSTENDILTFELAAQTGPATIDTDNHTIVAEVANGTDLSNLAPTITVSNAATIDPLSGVARDFSSTVNYTVSAEDSGEQLWEVTVTEAVAPASPCNPLSTLDCDQLQASLPLNLDFTTDNGKLSGSGMTMVLEPSARLAADDAVAHPEVPGFASSLITQDASGLSITSTKGILYSQPAGTVNSTDTNSQMNALGIGFTVPATTFDITARFVNPDLSVSTGNNSQQGGIWFGLDEDHYVKLAVLKTGTATKKVQLQVENMDNTTTETAFLEVNTGDIAAATEITLRLELDPVNNTVTGYYTLDGGSEILVSDITTPTGVRAVPASYFSGISYDAANPSDLLNFAGLFTTQRRALVDQTIEVVFKEFSIEEQFQGLALNFSSSTLSFTGTGEVGEIIASKTVSLSASSGNPTVSFSDDPDSTEWLILPGTNSTGDVSFGIKPNLPAGSYSTTVFAIDDPDLGYENAEITVNLEITGANNFAANINFSDPATAAPPEYLMDSGDPYADRGNGFSYGWLDAATSAPANLTLNGRNRNVGGVSLLNNTLIHMQYGDISTNAANGYLPNAKWELEVPNGTYSVTVAVGDPNIDGSTADTPSHTINVEGVNAINDYVPTGALGTSTRGTSATVNVSVTDGRLTLDPLGGFNTKINSVEIAATSGGVQSPMVVGVIPLDGASGISVNTSISANNLFLPNFDTNGIAGVDNSTITTSTVRLFKQGNPVQIGASVNGTGGGDAINLVPNQPLEANTTYIFEIDGVTDLTGEPFEFFTSSFTTNNGGTGPSTDLDNVSFTKVGSVASGGQYTTLTIGPDGKLYGLEINGDIHRWSINPDGTLDTENEEVLSAWKSAYGARASVGFVFDPGATAANLIAYITHNSSGLSNAPDWDGKLSRLSGTNLENEELLLTDLPRSLRDHLTNSIVFRDGEPNILYFNQGSLSAAGAPDGAWGNREESLLSAATLRLDLTKLPGTLPLNVRTSRNIDAIKAADVNSPTLDGLYNPYYSNAPLTLFATGVRNAYDLAWHSNGQLYIPTNGTAGGSNAPASIDDMRRPDGTFYDHNDPSGDYPVIPASNSNNVQRDWLFRVNPLLDLGYYGHPNPFRGEFVLNRGDEDVTNAAYNGVQPDINYHGAAYDFEFNKSPNGVIEYKSNAENGNLQGALLVVRYSGGSDIIALVPDGPNGDIGMFKEGIPGFTGFSDPLDLVEDVNTGNIYVSDFATSQIILLKPSNQAAPTPAIVLNTDAISGDAITSGSNTYTEEVLLSNLGNAPLENIQAEITGPDASQFSVNGLVSSLNVQNSDSFNVVFDPTSDGPKFAVLTISGTDAVAKVINLSGLGKLGTGGANEPSLQWILDTKLGAGVVNVGDTNPSTNLINLPGGNYNDALGDEVDIERFERATDAPVTLELLSVYGPEANNPIVAFGWYPSGNAASTTELFTVQNNIAGNGQTINPITTGALQFDPGLQSFGFYSRWPFFGNRQLFSEDLLNTFTDAIPHHVRVYELPGETNAYIIATEEHISGFDYQDIVVIARNIRSFSDTPALACTPISTRDCDELEIVLPFSLAFNGSEGGLSNTGFTMVDNPSARLAEDGPISNPDVPGYEPSKLSFNNGNLLINASKGIAFVTNASSTEVNSQINTLGAGLDASAYGNFSIETSVVNPYGDATNNSEQAGLWFGLNEDNFVKLVAANNNQIEIRAEIGGLSGDAVTDRIQVNMPNLSTSTVGLRLFVDLDNNLLTGHYTIDGGSEVEIGSLPLPAAYINGNASYSNLSFAGIFATKRREDAGVSIDYTFEDFAITQENFIAFDPIRINFSLPADVPPAGYLTDSGAAYGDRGNGYSYGWLTTDGLTALNLSTNARNRNVAGISVLQNTLMHMQYNDVGGTNGVNTEGIWEIDIPNGIYDIFVGVGDPNIDTQEGTTPSHTINVEGLNIIDGYVPVGIAANPGQFTSGEGTVTVTDGRLTIDAFGGHNTKINSLQITQSLNNTQPLFTNVTPANNAVNVALNDFQINVELVVPLGYELDNSTLGGNINLYEVTVGGDVLVPSNSNDTGGGDAITLTPLDDLKEFTTYRFELTGDIEANKIGDLADRLSFIPFESTFTTGEFDDEVIPIRDLTGVEFTKVLGGPDLGDGTIDQRFSSLVIGPDGKLYGSTIGDFISDGQIYRWEMALDGTLSNLEILTPQLEGSPHPVTGPRSNNNRLIIGLAFDPAATADNLIAYVTHSTASVTNGPEWDGKLTRLSGPDLSVVQDVLIHLPRSSKDHLTNSIIFDDNGDGWIIQGSNSAGGAPDPSWDNRPERLLSAAVLKLEFDKLPPTLPLSVYTTDNISVINSASSNSITMSDGTYNPYAANSPLTIFATGPRNAYDLLWHSNGWLYIPTNGTAGNNTNSPNSPASADYTLARRIDGLTNIPPVPALIGGETQKDWLFKTQGGSYHGHPNPLRGEFVLNHGGISYSGLPGQVEASYTDVVKYPDNLQPDLNYREPAYDFGKNKSPNGVLEYKSDAFGGKLEGLIMVVRFSGQDDLLVLDPQAGGDIQEAYNNIPGLSGFDDPLDVIEDPLTGNVYISEYDRDNNGTARLTLLRANTPATIGPEIVAAPEELIFEITTNGDGENTDAQTVTVTNEGNEVLNITSTEITGTFAGQFNAVSPSGTAGLNPGESLEYTITYAPDLDGSNLGYQPASLDISSNDAENPIFSIGLHALKKAGYEGGEEPTLQNVVNTLGIGINVGWTNLAYGTDPDPVGEEVEVDRWAKAGNGPVTITPVARYSPAEAIPFGWYTTDDGIVTNEVGVLADDLDNAQTLFPEVASGGTSFDPQGSVFGIYVFGSASGTARFTYSEDAVNLSEYPGTPAHKARIYPMAERDGTPIENSYLVAFEDAANGDYQDYDFIINNVAPFEDGTLVLDFNKTNLNFTASIGQEDIPVQRVSLSGNGGIIASAISLEASDPWIVLPAVNLSAPMDIGLDITSLPIGTYQGTVTASAPNYEDAVLQVNLTVTNELVYTYQFNFQDPDDIEPSPAGYIDDTGVPFGVQSTSQGNLSFGWVLPGTNTPASAAANGRNRNTGVDDDPLLKTFTIIGHRTVASFPTLDWVAEVPNGSYYVNMSVGDSDFSDSNHILDVNGVTVINFDQENNNPDNLTYFNNTAVVEVTDGTLRLSLATGGVNAKPNFIRLAPLNPDLLPPSILADFQGTPNAPDIFRGPVQVTLQAIAQNASGITSFVYELDGAAPLEYTDPIDVTSNGTHELVVTAEDGNGNVATETFSFAIEPPTGALIAIENMTKIPGTNRGFPADDYYTFHRLGDPGAALVHDSNVMRLNNTGTGDLIVSNVVISDVNDFTYEALDATGAAVSLPLTIAPGSFADLDITFIGNGGTVNNAIMVESIQVVSNADNGLESMATLHGAYSPQPEGGDEITAQEVFNAFGFSTSMLSIVNDEGTISPPNLATTNPSSNYPVPANIDAGYEGDMILSDNFVQAVPGEPVIGIQISALHGVGSNGARFVQTNGTSTVGGINFSHDGSYYQTLLPKNTSGLINFDTSANVSGAFRIAVSNYLTSGGNNIDGNRPDLLGCRVYKVLDRDGNVVPNEYIVLQDFVQNGCGAGSANCDWNDNTFYFINIRPQAVPAVSTMDALLAAIDVPFNYEAAAFFNKGYPGNILTFSATLGDGSALPTWMSINPHTGSLSGTPPAAAQFTYTLAITAIDLNGLTTTGSLQISISLPPVAVDDAAETVINTPVLLDQLLVNDSDPNGEEINIVSVDNPVNGTVDLVEANNTVTFTPATNFTGEGSFTYTIEDESGLTDDATVTVTVTETPPTALAQADINSGIAPLEVNFTGSGSTDDSGITGYFWDFKDGNTSTEADPTHSFELPGTYEVSLVVTNTFGLTDEDIITIDVDTPVGQGPTAIATASVQSGNAPLQVSFTGSNSTDNNGVTGYLWDFDDGDTSSLANPDHTFTEPGVYEVSLLITDVNGFTDQTTLNITVNEPGVTLVPILRLNAGGPEVTYNGDLYQADQYFVGGKVFANTSATVPPLYQTERSASPPTFAYEIPLADGEYQVILHFAEIYWGATGGGALGTNQRIFDVSIEGNLEMDNYDINADVGPQTPATKTFDVLVTGGVLNLNLSALSTVGGVNQPKLSALEVYSIITNDPPVANASADILTGVAPLGVAFTGGNSTDDKEVVSYLWDFADGGTSTEPNPLHTFTGPGTYGVTLTVADVEGLTDTETLTIMVNEPVTPDFALRINAGGPQLTHEGELFLADQNFVGGKVYANTSATVPALYQTERSASPPAFAYDIPLADGQYQVILHFAEIYWGATGGGTLGTNQRIFDVAIEGITVLNDYNINADVGPQTPVTKVFDVVVTGGELNLNFSALSAVGGVDQPKLSGIEIFLAGNSESPVVDAGADQNITLPTNSIVLNGSGSDPDGGSITEYEWTQQSGPNTASLTNATTANLTAGNLVEGSYVFRLTVTDDEEETGFDEVTVTVSSPSAFALRINTGGSAATYNGNAYVADQYFDTGTTLDRPQTGLPEPYKTIRYSPSQVMGYDIPLDNGEYTVNLHFAELWFGATGGGTGGSGLRVFDVSIEGSLVEDNLDIFVEVGAQTMLVKTYTVTVSDGELNIDFSSLASADGVRHPAINAIEVLGDGTVAEQPPVANAGPDQNITLPTNSIVLNGSGTDPDGGSIAAYSWTQESGPSQATLANANTAALTVQDLEAGTYVFRLTVTDDENDTAFDEVTVLVEDGGGSELPTANAGQDQIITLPDTDTVLLGSGTDPDGGSIAAYSWTQESGPSQATLANASTATLTVQDLEAGTYVFRLTVTDDENDTAFDEVTVTVSSPSAFALRINTGGSAATYNGNAYIADQYFDTGATLDRPQTGLAEPYKTFRFSRSEVMGYDIPVENGEYTVNLHFAELWFGATGGGAGGSGLRVFDVSIEGSLVEDNLDIFAEVGAQTMLVKTYTVTVLDGELNIDFSSLASAGGVRHPAINAIEVLGDGTVADEPPVANAGQDQIITLPDTDTVLLGSGTDPDGGSIAAYSWTQESGPSQATLANTNTAALTVQDLEAGTYVFRLTVTDDENDTAFDEVTVTVSSPSAFALRINTGGGAATYNGDAYIADQYFDTGATLDRPQTGLAEPYKTFRFSRSEVMGYDIPVENGEYTVNLHFAELWFGATGGGTGGSGLRVFDVSIEGNLVEDNLDIYDEVGAQTMLVRSYTVTVLDGELNIDFSSQAAVGGARHPVVNAIEVLEDGTVADKLVVTQTGLTKEDVIRERISIYPNPSHTTSEVATSNMTSEIQQVLLFDVTGRLVRQYNASQLQTGTGTYQIEVSGLEEGTYFVKFITADARNYYKQLVVKKR